VHLTLACSDAFVNRWIQITIISSSTQRCDGCRRATCLKADLCPAYRAEGVFYAAKEELVNVLQEDVVSLAYLMDIFGRLNELTLSLQGYDKTINFIDVLSAFQAKLELWERKMTTSRTGMFPTLNELLEDTEDVRLNDNIKSKIINNLYSLRGEFANYFPDIARDDSAFVRNPYLVADTRGSLG